MIREYPNTFVRKFTNQLYKGIIILNVFAALVVVVIGYNRYEAFHEKPTVRAHIQNGESSKWRGSAILNETPNGPDAYKQYEENDQ